MSPVVTCSAEPLYYYGVYYVYILQCRDKSLYTGITNDLRRRLEEHKRGIASAYTRSHGADRIMYKEKIGERGAALRREAELKKWPRARKMELIRRSRGKKV